jgi:hypothetical protein
MTWIAVAIGGAAVIGAVSQNSAANTQASADRNAAATQMNMFNTLTGQEQPFLQGGYGAETGLNKLLGTSPGSFGGLPNGYFTQTFNPTQQQLQNYPGYQFQLQQGDQALNNANAPGVGAVSGPALKSLMSFNQGLAGTNYSNYFNQFQTQQNNIFNRLSTIASLGQNAAGNLGNSGTQLGIGSAQAGAAAGAAQAGGQIGVGNSLGGAGTSLAYLLAGQNSAGNISSLDTANTGFNDVGQISGGDY